MGKENAEHLHSGVFILKKKRHDVMPVAEKCMLQIIILNSSKSSQKNKYIFSLICSFYILLRYIKLNMYICHNPSNEILYGDKGDEW